GGNRVDLLEGGEALFPRMRAAIAAARSEVWLASYIFHDDATALAMMDTLAAAAARGVAVHVVVDGFGTKTTLPAMRERLVPAGVRLEVFRPLERWYAWLQPGQLRRLHQKLCVCDEEVAFVGGINIIDDRLDLHHGWSELPRLDFAVECRGPLVLAVYATARAMWARAHLWHAWRDNMRQLAQAARPVDETVAMLRRLRGAARPRGTDDARPMRAAFLVRDNLRQRRAIERSYVEAMRGARSSIDLAVPYFYPGRIFRRVLRHAARRGVRVRLLLQGKVDYRIAALAARALYDELRGHGVHIFEYAPAFLHAKVAVVDESWATVGSSNIDPLSLLLNLEANVVVRDAGFARTLRARFEAALGVSTQVEDRPMRAGWRAWLRRAAVAWLANVYLRVAGITGRY
ncbi:MAG: cardiolipin synthase ClsB, partial [Comamonadaceae bacterium]|nr:cardiolipin synthase ClsB [Comamonadaceae bacterium]